MDQEQIKIYINELLDIDSRNITRELKRRSLHETCDYIEKHMSLVNSGFENRFELLEYAIRETKKIDGLWLVVCWINKATNLNHAIAHSFETKLEITPKEPLAGFKFIAKLSQQTTRIRCLSREHNQLHV